MFFDARSFSEPKLSMDHFREWAGSIAGSYLNSDVAPTTSLCKIAQSEELTPHQIEVLAAEVNKLIHSHKYASAEDKYLAADFPLADAKVAIATLQVGGEAKLAYVSPEPERIDNGPDAYSMWGIQEPAPMDKTASLRGELKVANERTELLSQKLGDRALLSKFALDAAENRFIKTARQLVLQGDNFEERLKVLGMVDHQVKLAGMPFARKSLAKLAYVLHKEGLLEASGARTAIDYFVKEADCKAPQELISPNLQARVVNGTHPLYISLKTFKDSHDRHLQEHSRGCLVDDRLQILRQRIRAL
jgi:hypothetical protein